MYISNYSKQTVIIAEYIIIHSSNKIVFAWNEKKTDFTVLNSTLH